MLREAKDDLAKSCISVKEAEAAGMWSERNASEVYQDFEELPSLIIPYMDPWTDAPIEFEREGETLPFCRVRYYGAKQEMTGFKRKKILRYSQPKNSGVHPYFPTVDGFDWREILEDPEEPLIITEGEKKALACCLIGLPTVGLGGVYNFSVDDALLPQLRKAVWEGRPTYICYDSDAATNANILAAEARLATELSLNHGANVFLVRIPEHKSGKKQGVDDYIAEFGEEALYELLDRAPQMRKIDKAVINMNKDVCWIAKDALVYEPSTGNFMGSTAFCNGSKYSAVEIIVPAKKGTDAKRVQVAKQWLTHPHARRYDDILFRPDVDSRGVRLESGGLAFNSWRGYNMEEGSVEPFLDLTKFVFSEMEGDQTIPLKLMAYKAQNPGKKIPLSLIMVGTQGSGKSMWLKAVRMAFGIYGQAVDPAYIGGDFNGYVENSLFITVDEIRADQFQDNIMRIRSLVSEEVQMMNEKYRTPRNVNSYCFVTFSSNSFGVGAVLADDRRFLVVNTPDKREDSFYHHIGQWLERGGYRNIMHYLVNLDLKGWEPPKQAPMTSAKYMAFMESLSPVQRLAEEMKTADDNVVAMWIQAGLDWAYQNELSNNARDAAKARELIETLPVYTIRPWYTPEEIFNLFPALSGTFHGGKPRWDMTPGTLSRELRETGIRYLRNRDNAMGFKWQGRIRQFLVIADRDEWEHPITQNEFERHMRAFRRPVIVDK